jgi:hypothetical protein
MVRKVRADRRIDIDIVGFSFYMTTIARF